MEDWKVRETAFMGKITAGMTHELRNVLAVIGESVGLVEDILKIKHSKGIDDRIEKKLVIVKEQILRGQAILTVLNRFAHNADHVLGSLDVRRDIDDMVVFLERFLRHKGVTCTVSGGNSIVLTTIPIMWSMVHFALLMSVGDEVPNKGRIDIICLKSESGVAVTFRSIPLPNKSFPSVITLLQDDIFADTLKRLNAIVEVGSDICVRCKDMEL